MSFCLRHFAYYVDSPNAVSTTVVSPNAHTTSAHAHAFVATKKNIANLTQPNLCARA